MYLEVYQIIFLCVYIDLLICCQPPPTPMPAWNHPTTIHPVTIPPAIIMDPPARLCIQFRPLRYQARLKVVAAGQPATLRIIYPRHCFPVSQHPQPPLTTYTKTMVQRPPAVMEPRRLPLVKVSCHGQPGWTGTGLPGSGRTHPVIISSSQNDI